MQKISENMEIKLAESLSYFIYFNASVDSQNYILKRQFLL